MISFFQIKKQQDGTKGAVVVTQLVERSLPIP